jgi:hypothetical protein
MCQLINMMSQKSNRLSRYLIYDSLLPPNVLIPSIMLLCHFNGKTFFAVDLPALADSAQGFQLKQRRTSTTQLWGSEKSA